MKYVLRVAIIFFAIVTVVYAADVHQIDPFETENFPATDHTPCAKIVHNGTGPAYFVGAKTTAEWQSFYNKVQGGGFPNLSINGCPP